MALRNARKEMPHRRLIGHMLSESDTFSLSNMKINLLSSMKIILILFRWIIVRCFRNLKAHTLVKKRYLHACENLYAWEKETLKLSHKKTPSHENRLSMTLPRWKKTRRKIKEKYSLNTQTHPRKRYNFQDLVCHMMIMMLYVKLIDFAFSISHLCRTKKKNQWCFLIVLLSFWINFMKNNSVTQTVTA